MRLSARFAGLLAIISAVAALPAHAATIWAADEITNSILRIDSTTGNILGSFLAPVQVDTIAGLTIAEGGNSLLFTSQPAPNQLFRLDPLTGAVLSTHAINGKITGLDGGLSFQTVGATDVILAVDDGAGVVRQDGFGGPGVSLGFGPAFPGALGGDDQGRHFLNDATFGLVEIDLAGNIVNVLGGAGGLSGLAFDGTTLYSVRSGTDLIEFRDPDTGAIIGVRDVAGNNRFSALAAAPTPVIPEPSAFIVFALGTMVAGGAAVARRRAA